MKVNELRIGNYIIYSPEPGLIKVVSGIRVESDINNKEYERVFFIDQSMKDCRGKVSNWIKPIPLTKNWLLEFGFNTKNYCDDDKSMFWEKGGFLLSQKFRLLDIDKTVDIEYVHQLQNLYFALTGKELILNN